jgi:TPR repeat protein
MKKLLGILAITGLLVATSAQAETPSKGIQAFEKGQYTAALRLLVSEADSGSTEAMYALGLMHEYGLGVNTSRSVAAAYYSRGAEISSGKHKMAEARMFINAIERTAN